MRYLKELEFQDLGGKTYYLKNNLATIKTIEEMGRNGIGKIFTAVRDGSFTVTKQIEIICRLTGADEETISALVIEKGVNVVQVRFLGLLSLFLGGESAIRAMEDEEDKENASKSVKVEGGEETTGK